MPDDVNGNNSLPSGYLAVTGQTIQPSQHNPPLEDISACLTARLSRSGVAPMTGPLKTVTGSAAIPAISPNNNSAIGLYWTATGIAFAGTVAGVRYIGELIPWTMLSAPALCVLPYGQTMLRASYPDLWAKAQTDIAAGNTFYNNGDGSTTFGIGDMRGRVVAGKDDMGGTAAGRLTSAGSGVNGAVLGATGGADGVVLTAAQLAPHTHSGTTGSMNRNASHNHSAYLPGWGRRLVSLNDSTGLVLNGAGNEPVTVNPTNTDHEHAFTTDGGTGLTAAAHPNAQPTLVCNYLLYVGA